ncbi:hypothetical protein PybrP1_006160 [[Pythium] brassicae (nom. inval.)]|nr:hypothetical protein PybrP1_006160 [[Pythium] brassicae (nom. inval.)]
MERVLGKWESLEKWFEIRAQTHRPQQTSPLEGKRDTLAQLLSLSSTTGHGLELGEPGGVAHAGSSAPDTVSPTDVCAEPESPSRTSAGSASPTRTSR